MQLHIQHKCFVHTQLHTRLIEFLLTALSCFFIYTHALNQQNVLKIEGSRSCLLENSIATACICASSYLSVPHTCCCWFIWKVFDVLVNMCCVQTGSCCVCSVLFRVNWYYIAPICSLKFSATKIYLTIVIVYCGRSVMNNNNK